MTTSTHAPYAAVAVDFDEEESTECLRKQMDPLNEFIYIFHVENHHWSYGKGEKVLKNVLGKPSGQHIIESKTSNWTIREISTYV